jgi:AcrR family transcriptional regulator
VSKSFAPRDKRQSTDHPGPSVSGRINAGVQERRPDRRIQRTRRTLHDALIKLILERGWDAVSVQDVCKRADVGRSTFYVHFADKEELLVSGFPILRGRLRSHLAPADGEPLGFTLALIEHAREFEPLFKALVGRRTALVVQRAFMDVVRELVVEDLGGASKASDGRREAAVSYVAGALWELLRWWFEQRNAPSAVEIGALFKQLTVPVLREIRRAPSEKDPSTSTAVMSRARLRP